VVDRTGLKGGWNFTLKWSTRIPGVPGTAAADAVPIFDALEKQLGLKLELTKAPTPVVVVDSVNQKPTDNLPEVSEKLPPPPMEFEVADIQPADPDDGIKGSNVSIQRGGRVRVNMPLKGLIQEAWNDWNPDRIVGGPKSMETARFNVEAKAPSPDLTDGPAVWNGVDIDSMRMMLRAVLVERFHLQAHLEDRPVSGYALVAGRPKLRKGGPGGPSELQRGPGGRREGSEAGESRGFAAGDLPEHDAGAVCGRTD
jgi:hypothetical protein